MFTQMVLKTKMLSLIHKIFAPFLLNRIMGALFFFSLLTFHFSLINSQSVHQEWVARYPGPNNDVYGPFLACDQNGNSYVAGTHVINDSINILCVKYNSSGVQQWATLYKYPGYGYFAPAGIAIDSLGNAYITAYYGVTALTSQSILTIKLNNLNGIVQWARSYTGQYNIRSESSDIKVDRMNNIYVVGYADSSLICLKYNINGDNIWVRQYHVSRCNNYANACTIDDSSNIIITGASPSYYYLIDSMITIKYNTNGIFLWEKSFVYSNSPQTNGTKIVADQNGNIFIGGRTYISGYQRFITLKFDGNGIFQWSSCYQRIYNWDSNLENIIYNRQNNFLVVTGTANLSSQIYSIATIKYNPNNGDSIWVKLDTGIYKNSSAGDIETDSSGNIYVTGGTGNVPIGSIADVYTVKYSSQGNIIWQITYNGPFNGGNGGIAIALDKLDKIYVMGVSQSSPSVYDYIVIKYSQLDGISAQKEKIPKNFKLYQNFPNPFNPVTEIKYDIPKKSFIELNIYDLIGKKIKNLVNEIKYPGNYKIDLDMSNFSSGIYFYQFVADNYIINTKKFVVIK